MPDAVIIAGPNGAGKTTFARQFLPLALPGATFLNADEISRESPRLASPMAADTWYHWWSDAKGTRLVAYG